MPTLECDYEVAMPASRSDAATALKQAIEELSVILGGSIRRGIELGPARFIEFDAAAETNAYWWVAIRGLNEDEANLIDEAVGTQS